MSEPSGQRALHRARPETELLLACAGRRDPQARHERIRSLSGSELDWEYLIRVAYKNEVMLFLHKSLVAAAASPVAGYAADQLRGVYELTTRRNRTLLDEMFALLQRLEGGGCPVIPYKGPELSAHFYGNAALRRFIDIDLIVHESNVAKARDILIEDGYTPFPELGPGDLDAYVDEDSHLSFFAADGRAPVEIHWRFVPKHFAFDFDMESAWARLDVIEVEGHALKSLTREDLLLSLSVHGAKHLWRELVLVCDIDEIIGDGDGIDWGRVAENARALRCERMLYLALRLARDLLGAPLPAWLSDAIDRNVAADALARMLVPRLFAEEDFWLEEAEMVKYHLKLRENLRDGLPYAMSHLRGSLRKWLPF